MVKHNKLSVFPCRFQQIECAVDIGADEFFSGCNGAIHVGFRRKVHNVSWLEICKEFPDSGAVADIHFHEIVTRICGDFCQCVRIPCISEFIQHADSITGFPDQPAHQCRSDKSRSPCDNDPVHKKSFRSACCV